MSAPQTATPRTQSARSGRQSVEAPPRTFDVAAGLAHELRNPLTTIKVLFDALQRKGRIQQDAASDAAMIARQIDRLEKIIDGYLSSSRAETRAGERKPIDLNLAVNESLLLLAASAREGTRFELNQSEGLLSACADAFQISQVIYNLALNAIQATEKRGRIGITTGKLSSATGNRIYVSIQDDGPGITPRIKAHLFEPFHSTKEDGVGLGLLIVKRIVDAHGGTLEVESPRLDIGRGARFTVTLPELVDYQI